MKELCIHNYEKRFEWSLKRINELRNRNKEILQSFIDHMLSTNISKPRIIKYVEILYGFSAIVDKDFDKIITEDIKAFMRVIQQKDYSPWTKVTHGACIKRFYKWLKGNDKSYPAEVEWIKTTIKRSEMKLPSESDLLTQEEINKLIEVAEHPRDKAFIAVLSETGARIGEHGVLRIKDVTIDKYGAIINIYKGKTGARRLRVVSSTPYLMTWLQSHPLKGDPESPLWVNFGTTHHNKMMTYGAIRSLIRELARRAGIKKRIYPHIFRHSRASYLANHLKEFQMNQYFGWIQGSDMPAVYVHLSGRDLDDSILALNGVKEEKKEEEDRFKPKICPRCDTINNYNSKFCNKCAGILDVKTAIELEEQNRKEKEARTQVDDIMNRLIKYPEVLAVLSEKVKGLGN